MPVPDRKRTRRGWTVWLLALGALAVTVWLLGSYAAAYRLTHRAGPQQPEPAPALAWGRIQPFRLATADGQELGAWFIDGHPDRPLVLFLHGNGGRRSACLKEAELIAATGSPVLMISFRAHGDSTGEVNDFGYSGRRDVVAAVEWLSERHPGRPVVVWGQSLGSAAAVFAAAELGNRVAGYILECPYQDLRTATRNRTRTHLPPGLEYVAYAGFSVVAPMVLSNVEDISPLTAAARIPASARVLVLAGSADRRAKPSEAAAIADTIGERAELVVIEGGDHLHLAAAEPERYRKVVTGFLKRCAPVEK
ncbi:alpha/beta fold hydrolase [Gemmata sp. JC673]|uniref:Alpha/beta fold hydrolase n=1 Tax=Gemmata algarum TaxID=2975278 RepID=A0ABU5F5L7_9BACT|nr:alpha/beta fold hydrolase [Gemmata algarum]MDY3562878.1 alpha/beta fold hydrolase [Gemmata algarum]